MLEGEKGVLIGYSGGADSSALLHILSEVCKKNGLQLHAVHVHHGIRGAEADRDAEFCKAECARLGIRLTLEYVDVPSLAANSGRGIEETARACRYEAFFSILSENSELTCIATAHNADDNAETVIFNLARGSGIDGLRGIPPVRTESGVRIIRPLIASSKGDILGYCDENGIEYIFDSTNADTAYTRNYIRHEILPRFASLNPSFLEAVGRMSANLRVDSQYIEEEAKRFAKHHVQNGKIDAAILAKAPQAIASRIVSAMYRDAGGHMLERVHAESLLALAKNANEGSSISLGGKIRAKIEDCKLYFTSASDTAPPVFCKPLHPGANRFDELGFAIYLSNESKPHKDLQKDNETLQNIYKLSILTQVNSDKISNVLFARSRRDGDSYVFGKMTRKLKKLYNDRGISPAKRAMIPVICDDDGIVWVPGFPAADRVKSNSEKTTIIYYCNGENDE